MKSSLLKIASSAHWYAKDGQPSHDSDLRDARKRILYPSVTTVDKDVFKNDFLDKWKLNQLVIAACENPMQPHENPQQYAQRIYEISMEKATVAAEFGKKVHDACEKYPQEPSPDVRHWYDKFDGWYKGAIRETIQPEYVILDHDIGVAGRTDLKCILRDGRLAIIDYKTQDVKVDDKGRKKPAFYDAWPRQLGFYAVGDAKTTGLFPQIPECISLIIDSNDGGEVYAKHWEKQEILDAYRTFVAGAWLWFDKRGFWPVGSWSPSYATDHRQVPMPIP